MNGYLLPFPIMTRNLNSPESDSGAVAGILGWWPINFWLKMQITIQQERTEWKTGCDNFVCVCVVVELLAIWSVFPPISNPKVKVHGPFCVCKSHQFGIEKKKKVKTHWKSPTEFGFRHAERVHIFWTSQRKARSDCKSWADYPRLRPLRVPQDKSRRNYRCSHWHISDKDTASGEAGAGSMS